MAGVNIGGINLSIRVDGRGARQELSNTQRNLLRFNRTLSDTENETRNLTQQIGALPTAIAAVGAALGAARLAAFGRDAALLAARVENLATVLNNVGRIAGQSGTQLGVLERNVKRLGITTQAARRSLTQLAQANIDLSRAAELTRVAQDAAVIAGVNSSQAFERLVLAIQRNDVRLLRNLGIVINLNNVYARFAQETGRTTKSLTAFEKRQLVLNEVLDKGRLIAGTYEAALQDVGKQISSLPRLTEEATVAVGNQFLPVLREGVSAVSDFLKAFPSGGAFITPRAVANIITFGTAVVGLGAAAGSVKLLTVAFGALTALTGPIGLLSAAVVGLGALAATAFVDATIEAENYRKELNELKSTQREFSQSVFDTRRDLQDLGGETAFETLSEDAARFDSFVQRLALRFPQFRKELEAIRETGSIAELEAFFGVQLPRALQTSQGDVQELQTQLAAAEQTFRNELEQTLNLREREARNLELTDRVKRDGLVLSIKSNRVLEAQRAVQSQLNTAVEQGAEVFARQNKELLEAEPLLRGAARAAIEAREALEGAERAQLFADAQQVDAELKVLQQAANLAINETKKLQTQRRNLFKNTNARILLDFTQQQQALRTEAVKTDSELRDAANTFREAQEAEAEATFQSKQRQALAIEDLDKREKALSNARRERVRTLERIEEQATNIVSEGTRQREAILDAEALSIDIVNQRLSRQRQELQALIETQELQAAGVSPRLIKLNEQLAKAREESIRSVNGLQIAIARLDNQIRKRELQLQDRAEGDSALAAALGVSDPQLRKLRNALEEAQRLQEESFTEIENRRAQLADQTRKRIEEDFRRIEQEEQRILNRVRKIRAAGELEDETPDRSFEGLNRSIRQARQQGLEVQNFLRQFRAELSERGLGTALSNDIDVFSRRIDLIRRSTRDVAIPGFSDLTQTVEQFRQTLERASSPQQIQQLERAFAFTLRDRIVQSRNELRGLREQLEAFRTGGRRTQERDQRLERQRRLNELFEAGVDQQTARREISRLEAEDRAKLNAQEEELEKKIRESQRSQKALNDEVRQIEESFSTLADKQRAAVQQLVEDQKELNRLKREELSLEEKALEAVRKRRAGATTAAERFGAIDALPTDTGIGDSITKEIAAQRKELDDTGSEVVNRQKKVTKGLTELQQLLARNLKNIGDEFQIQDQVIAQTVREILVGQRNLLVRSLNSRTGGAPR